MIDLYSGCPGSGKSLQAAYRIIEWLEMGKSVIANFPINMGYFEQRIKRKKTVGEFYCVENWQLKPLQLRLFSHKHLEPCKEHQALIVIDECGSLFNTRMWNAADRMEWIMFLQNHRKYGYDIMLVSQSDIMIDKQIRPFIETEYRCRDIRNFRTLGLIVALLCGGHLFCKVEMWYQNGLRCGSEFFFLNKRKANIYNTYKLFDTNINRENSKDLVCEYDDLAIPKPKIGKKSRKKRKGIKR